MPTTQVVQELPQTVEEADHDMREMQRLLREMEEARASRDAELHPILEKLNPLQAQADQIRERAEAALNALQEEYNNHDRRVRAFSQSHRRELERAAKAKLFRFPCGGFVRWKLNPPYLKITGKLASIVAQLRRAGREDLFEVKYSLKRAAIKKDKELVKKIRGLSIAQDEVLIVDPNG